MTEKGAFIVLEGLDGSGKTTQAKLLVNRLKQSRKAVYTAEPSRGKIGMFIRKQILYAEKRPPVCVEGLLFAADRIDHMQREVQPALENGHLVVCDRYIYSSLAYQGGEGLGLDWIQTINEYALKPDLALFIDVSPETVLNRLRRKKSLMENLDTQRKVREVYLNFAETGDLVLIDGNKARKEVAELVFAQVSAFLNERG